MKQSDLLDQPAQEAEPVNGTPINLPVVQAADPMTLIVAAATNPKTDADKMERLLAVYERLEAHKRRDAYNAAMSLAQAEMPSVVRDKENLHLKTKYARLETVAAAISPVYTKHGFSLSFGTLPEAAPDCIKIFCDCRHSAGHVDRIEGNFPLDLKGSGGTVNKTGIQAMGSTISYARRYLTLMIFNVAIEDEDNDGNGAGPDVITAEEEKRITQALLRMPEEVQVAVVARIKKWLQIEELSQIPKSEFRKALDGILKEGDRFNS